MNSYDGTITIGTEIDLSGIEQKLDKMASIMESKTSAAAEKASAKASRKLASGMTVGISILTNLVNKAMSVVGSSLSDAFSRTDTLNNFSNVMSTLGVDSKDAADSINYMSEKLIGLPTTLDQGAMAVKRFTSANNNVKASTEMFLALNNAILAGGAPMQQQAMALEQMSQAYAKNKPDMMEWRTVLTAMPAQLNQVAKEMGFLTARGTGNATALGEALRKGDVSMNDFMLTFVKLNNMKGPESLAEQAKQGTAGIQTAVANLKNAVVRAVAEVIETIGHQNIVQFINNIQKAIIGLFPYIAAFVRSFVVAVNVVASVLGRLFKLFNGLFGKKQKKETKETAGGIGDVSYAIGGVGDSADKATGAAKKLNKELGNLQGFDEMNVLQEPSSSSGGGGGGADGGAGDIGDLGDLGDVNWGNITSGMKDLAKFADICTAAIWGLIAAFIAFKITGNLLKSIGIGLIIMGIVYVIEKVLDYLKDPSWENFGKILLGIAVIVAGLALAFGSTVAIIGAIILLIGAVALAVYKNWDKIKAFISKIPEWINQAIQSWWNDLKNVVGFIIEAIITYFENLKNDIMIIFQFIVDEIKKFFQSIKNWFNDLVNVISFVWEKAKEITVTVINAIAGMIKNLWNGIIEGAKNAVNIVKTVFNNVVSFFKNIVNSIVSVFSTIGTKVGDAIGKAFKGAINAVLRVIENILNNPIKAINSLIGAVNKLPGVSLSKLNTFRLPRLAQGGIINQPGRGVAIGGESGREGVIPLTDNQQMELLGEAIGRYITVNANITNTMNGRVISRELQKINNESDFAFNR